MKLGQIKNYLHVILLITLKKIKVDTLEAGDIIAVSGIENINIGELYHQTIILNRCHV